MISMTCDPRRETVRFVWRNATFRFRGFWLRRRPKRNGPAASGVQIATLESLPELVEGTLRWWARTRAGWKFQAAKKLRKGAVKPLKSLARANLCAGAERRGASPAATGQERDVLTPVNARSKRFIWNRSARQAFLRLCLDPQPFHFIEARAIGGSAGFR